jgi:hypothetical protein
MSAGQSCSLKYSTTGAAAASFGQARKHCQFGKAPMTERVIQLTQRSSQWPQRRRLTVKLRGRGTAPDRRRGRTLSPGAGGAKPTTHHGPLQRLLEPTAPTCCLLPKERVGDIANAVLRQDREGECHGESHA